MAPKLPSEHRIRPALSREKEQPFFESIPHLTVPKDPAAWFEHHDWCIPHSTQRLKSCLQSTESILCLPKKSVQIHSRDGRDSSGRSRSSGVAPRAMMPFRTPRGTRQLSHAGVTDVSRTGGPHHLGEPLPHQLTIRAQTSPSHPTSISNHSDTRADGSTHRCQWLDPTRMCRSTCDPAIYCSAPCLGPFQSIWVNTPPVQS